MDKYSVYKWIRIIGWSIAIISVFGMLFISTRTSLQAKREILKLRQDIKSLPCYSGGSGFGIEEGAKYVGGFEVERR